MPDATKEETETTSQDQPDLYAELAQANERAERAEAKLAELNAEPATPDETAETPSLKTRAASTQEAGAEDEGEAALRKDSMMAYLMDSLDAGKDIGHYGRLVFAMVARHFLPEEEMLGWLTRDPDFSEEQAALMLRQVESRDYNPPKRERILSWQAEQTFPILPNPEDPDCGNLYRNLKFPDSIYHHIEQYQEQKVASEETSGD